MNRRKKRQNENNFVKPDEIPNFAPPYSGFILRGIW